MAKLTWFGHASFGFEGSKVVYTDPWELSGHDLKADIILVTHGHFDHCSETDIRRLIKPGTDVVTTQDCAAKLSGISAKVVKPGDTLTLQGVRIEAVPAYNIDKEFHPKKNGWVGFVFTLDGERIYQAGDTDLIPEMKNIKAEVAILPVGGTYTMDAKEAATAVSWIGPKLAIPMHWGKVIGSKADAEEFKRSCRCEVEILSDQK